MGLNIGIPALTAKLNPFSSILNSIVSELLRTTGTAYQKVCSSLMFPCLLLVNWLRLYRLGGQQFPAVLLCSINILATRLVMRWNCLRIRFHWFITTNKSGIQLGTKFQENLQRKEIYQMDSRVDIQHGDREHSPYSCFVTSSPRLRHPGQHP